MNCERGTVWTRIFEDIDEACRGIERFENDAGPTPQVCDTRDRRRAALAIVTHSAPTPSLLVRNIEDGRCRTIALNSFARDHRGWWLDLERIVEEGTPATAFRAMIRRPDRTGGEYEVCFEARPQAWEREPYDLPGNQGWCHVDVVANIPRRMALHCADTTPARGDLAWTGHAAGTPSSGPMNVEGSGR